MNDTPAHHADPSPGPVRRDDLDDLLATLCEGTITAADFARLESMLATDDAARRRYILTMELHADLAYSDGALNAAHAQSVMDEAATLAAAEPVEAGTPKAAVAGRIHRALKAAMIVLVPALALGLLWSAGWFAGPGAEQPTLATLTPGAGAEFRQHAAADTHQLTAGRIVELTRGSADMAFTNGSQVTLSGATSLRIDSSTSATLMHGRISAFVPPRAAGFTVHTEGFRVVDLGTRFSIHTSRQHGGEVRVDEGHVQVIPDIRLPRVFLNFDSPQDLADPVSRIKVNIQGEVKSTAGIVGQGAIAFANEKDGRVNLGNGGGTDIGTGAFAARDGITIEAMIIPRWSGQGWSTRTAANPEGTPYDYDQIFRKEDGDRRILLSFQDDRGAEQQIIPIVDPGPCLTFGLYLEGIGYNELDMPLDGQAGRPTLKELQDGKPHHVVATYDAATGMKAIYIDGTLRFRHRFTPGSRVVCGGSANAVIGNAPHADEAFTGVIDEFAFYDAALTPAEVMGHWRNVQAGRNYFGDAKITRESDGKVIAIMPLGAGQSVRFDADTRLPVAQE